MHADYGLPASYTKFGKVIEGQDVVDEIAEVATNSKDKPTSHSSNRKQLQKKPKNKLNLPKRRQNSLMNRPNSPSQVKKKRWQL
jgi:hypothetical protein